MIVSSDTVFEKQNFEQRDWSKGSLELSSLVSMDTLRDSVRRNLIVEYAINHCFSTLIGHYIHIFIHNLNGSLISAHIGYPFI